VVEDSIFESSIFYCERRAELSSFGSSRLVLL